MNLGPGRLHDFQGFSQRFYDRPQFGCRLRPIIADYVFYPRTEEEGVCCCVTNLDVQLSRIAKGESKLGNLTLG